GCHVDNYLSDITRTVCCGPASDEAKQVYRVVFKAHMAARAAIYPGVTCESIDQAAREVIEAAGYGEYFVHRTGHGIGLMGHEPPHMVAGSTSPLEVGQCFSVEPGIYLPGKFGVRIENIVAVTENGHESLNEEPAAELIEIGV
ncbi:MAG: M24 family metallopeptidase, partial [Armatimonadetes bacterium]|nr:M24 family metallopeptidase [Armatimonadota bacterium]